MQILNLAASALFESLQRHNIDRELLLKGTSVNLDYILDTKKKHSWHDFVIMYDNIAELLGPELAAREIGHNGLYNENLGTLRKMATGFVSVRAVYWFLATIGCRHLFKDYVKFEYKKIKSNIVTMEITIAPELEDCPLLLETYTYLFENTPTLLGLPKAHVQAVFTSHNGLYTIKIPRTSYITSIFSNLVKSNTGYKNALLLMEELETQSLQMEKLLEEKSELVRIMSHDISNLSLAIDMSLKKVLRNGNLNSDDEKILTDTKKRSEQLSIILQNVQRLEVSQIRGIDLEIINLNEIFHSTAEHFKAQLTDKNINLVLQNNLPANINPVAEKSSFELGVLSNLINNAIKFSNEGSNIILEATYEKNKVLIVIKDQGRGMSHEERKNLFIKKLRKSTLGTKGEMGNGLGLGIVATYVRLYKGEISAHQNFPTGTVIKIVLPAFDQH